MADAASDLGGGAGLLLAVDPIFDWFTYLQPFFYSFISWSIKVFFYLQLGRRCTGWVMVRHSTLYYCVNHVNYTYHSRRSKFFRDYYARHAWMGNHTSSRHTCSLGQDLIKPSKI